MKIKSGLVYNKSSGKLIGFTELGNINEELNEFERIVDGKKPKEFATHVICFMARGLIKHFNYPIGYFASCGFDSDQLFPIVWEAVRVLEMTGFIVRAFISDGATPNRRFYRLHKLADGANLSIEGVVYWTWNRYQPTRKIYFISDPPHLMKTLRNNFENSHGHNNTRQLTVSLCRFFLYQKNIAVGNLVSCLCHVL